jgi:flavin-dependent dehydrogenase
MTPSGKEDAEIDRVIADIAERQYVKLGIPYDPAEYDRWFREKVQAALDDARPGIPHEEVVRRMDRVIQRAVDRRKQREQHGDL